MSLSVFDLFKIGIGPSSSHTVGPMWAVHRFLLALESRDLLNAVARIEVRLYGSLALTGKGHATDTAVLLGLLGETPDKIDPDTIAGRVADIRRRGKLRLFGGGEIAFDEPRDLVFCAGETMPGHPNGMRITARDRNDVVLLGRGYYSVGGGFVIDENEAGSTPDAGTNLALPYSFRSAQELLAIGDRTGLSIADIVMENERARRSDAEIAGGLRDICKAMRASIERGCRQSGILPGGLQVRRRAHDLHQELVRRQADAPQDPLAALDWVSLYALAVNEENAAGGRIVTAPTNGAAGVIPAVLAYYDRFIPGADEAGRFRFLLTAAAIGMLYKSNASISAAEVGCQGEVGTSCAMAAGGATAMLGGTARQIEQAAEIGIEHHLGMTCDPIMGLVQVPCIERNAMGAVKALNAAALSLASDGLHLVSLDRALEVMRQTGLDMNQKYKETSTGGLALG